MYIIYMKLFLLFISCVYALRPSSQDSIRRITFNKNQIPETSYKSLLNKIKTHEVEKLYFPSNTDVVISENEYLVDDIYLDYSVTQISPELKNSLVDFSITNNVEPVFYKSVTQPSQVQTIASGVLGFIDSLFLPSIFLFLIINSIRAFLARSVGGGPSNNIFGSFPGSLNIDIKKDKETMISSNITLESFAGSPEVFEECTEVISFLKNETAYKNAGATIPRGILLDGPPGTGKTLLAKAIASETNANFVSISASEFVELFVGAGASKIRKLFSTARNNVPCIIFIDEIDAVGRQRGAGSINPNEEREQTLNQLLSEMDGFANNTGILVIAATNRKDILDKALLRPGRFDRTITVALPDKNSRKDILLVHAKNKKFSPTVNFDFLAEITTEFSGAQLKNLLNEAAIYAARKGNIIITEEDIFNAFDKQLVGLVRKTDSRPEVTKWRVAVHEAGHALLCQNFSDQFELKKVSILSTYNGAGGYTLFNERKNATNDGLPNKDFLLKRLVIAFGGRAAESIVFGDDYVSVGASQDISYINQLASQMVNQFHLDSKLLMDVTSSSSQYLLNRSDTIVEEIINNAYQTSLKNLNRTEIYNLANRLMRETTIVF